MKTKTTSNPLSGAVTIVGDPPVQGGGYVIDAIEAREDRTLWGRATDSDGKEHWGEFSLRPHLAALGIVLPVFDSWFSAQSVVFFDGYLTAPERVRNAGGFEIWGGILAPKIASIVSDFQQRKVRGLTLPVGPIDVPKEAQVRQAYIELREKQKMPQPTTTDRDKIAAAFRVLRERGFVAWMFFGATQEAGFIEAEYERADGKTHAPVIFFHGGDHNAFDDAGNIENVLMLSHDGTSDEIEAAVRILKDHGLHASWDGNRSKRVEVRNAASLKPLYRLPAYCSEPPF